MAEDFLEEIYQEAKLISQLREVVQYARVQDGFHAGRKYNAVLPELIQVCQQYAQLNRTEAEDFSRYLQKIHDVSNEWILTGDIIERDLLPILEKSIQQYGMIQTENEEGDYLFQSSTSGFLTLKDLRHHLYVHSTVDPMWEAKQIAEYIFDPRKKGYSVLGCGLGYLIYQLYVISDGAVTIRVFERDSRMIEYARKYGVLNWIPSDCVEIVVDADVLPFLDSISEEMGFYILIPELANESEDFRPILSELCLKYGTRLRFRKYQEINYWSNLRHGCKMISEFDSSVVKEDVIVVAAGPSLDDSLDFLKRSYGKKTIIAVGTVFKKLLNQNLRPDMVMFSDPKEPTHLQIEGIEKETVPILLDITAYWKLAAFYEGEKYLIPTKGIEELDNIPQIYEDTWDGGGTVTHLALEAAVRFCAKRVFLVGVDMAYPGGVTHAAGTMLRSHKSEEELIPVEGNNGEIVYSDMVLTSYRHDLEELIARTPEISYYNMSCSGAKIAGTRNVGDEYGNNDNCV